jgi:hypothetical protein
MMVEMSGVIVQIIHDTYVGEVNAAREDDLGTNTGALTASAEIELEGEARYVDRGVGDDIRLGVLGVFARVGVVGVATREGVFGVDARP